VSDNYQPIAKALEKVRHDCAIDGELVAIDAHGISHFQLLQNALRATTNLQYCVFDLMALDGKDLRGLPLVDRKKRLQAVLPKDPLLIYSEHWPEHGKKLFKEASSRGLEGIMAKRAASKYFSGTRSKDWLKIKTGKRQEVVIAGFTAHAGRGRILGPGAGPPRRQSVALYRPCRHRLFARRARRAARQAYEVAHVGVTIRRPREGRGGHDLGEAAARRRGQVHGVDVGRRDAPSGVPRVARGQAR
jgi:hypothetical protein